MGLLVKDLHELPGILEIGHGGRFPAPPGRVFCIVIVLLPEDLGLPKEAQSHELRRDDVVGRDVV